MALLKAFVCQVTLLGLYKLFLEQVVEEHLVPDELTRNCLVGFVCLLCFGIQLYTDKADDNAKVEEDPKAKSKPRESTGAKKFESAEISLTNEIVTKTHKSKNPHEVSSTILPAESGRIADASHSGIFAEFCPNVAETVDVALPTVQSYGQETKTIQVFNGFSKVCEESDDEGIEIDRCISKESEEVERIKAEHVMEATVESDHLGNSKTLNTSTSRNLVYKTMVDEAESQITDGSVEEIEKNENEIEDGREIASVSGPDTSTMDIKETLPSTQKMDCTIPTSTKTVNKVETVNKSSADTPSVVNPTILSPRRKIAAEEDGLVACVSVDISFIYTCY